MKNKGIFRETYKKGEEMCDQPRNLFGLFVDNWNEMQIDCTQVEVLENNENENVSKSVEFSALCTRSLHDNGN